MSLKDKRLLLVEDNVLVAMDLADSLTVAGCRVVGPASTLDAAALLASQEALDMAVLDVDLHGAPIWPVAETLMSRNIPFVFLSGYGNTLAIPAAFRVYQRLTKPITSATLLRAILSLNP